MTEQTKITQGPLNELGKLSKLVINKLATGSDSLIGLLTIAFTFSIISIAIIGAALISEKEIFSWILGATILLFAGIVLAIVVISKASPSTTTETPKNNEYSSGSTDHSNHWKRTIADPASIINCQQKLSEKLRNIRERVHYLLINDYGQSIERRNIRANIFFPNEVGNGGYAYQLIRPTAFKDTDLEKKDDSFVLPPTLGATGWVFDRGLPSVTSDRLNRLPKWNEEVDKNMKWIVTLPIVGETLGSPFGVLNIDGVNENISEELLRKVSEDSQVIALVKSIAVEIDDLPKMEVSINSRKI